MLANQLHTLLEHGHDAADLRRSGAIRRHHDNDVADGTRQDAAPGHRLADSEADALAQGKRLARFPILDKFHARHESDWPDVSDTWQRPQGLEGFAHGLLQPGA